MEDVELELEAVAAVYGGDCRILERWPPRLEILLKPRTAEDRLLQFVEVVLSIRASDKYPSLPPKLELVIVKGLDVARQIELIAELEVEANQLSNEPMLVSISETAVNFLTANNYPDGHCCFCLFPLVDQALDHDGQPFMKLRSCFHCFHSDCFSDWWTWLSGEGSPARCPVCRASVQNQDIAHVKEISSSPIDQEEPPPTVSLPPVSSSEDIGLHIDTAFNPERHRNKKKHSTQAAKRRWIDRKVSRS